MQQRIFFRTFRARPISVQKLGQFHRPVICKVAHFLGEDFKRGPLDLVEGPPKVGLGHMDFCKVFCAFCFLFYFGNRSCLCVFKLRSPLGQIVFVTSFFFRVFVF